MDTNEVLQGLTAPSFIDDPYPAFARLRREAPVLFLEPFNAWLLTRFADVRTAFTDDRFQFQYERNQVNRMGERAREQDYFKVGREFLVVNDPPGHTRLKRIFRAPFTPRRVKELAPAVEERVRLCIDRFIEEGRADVVADFSHCVPLETISRLLGVPDSSREQILAWVSAFYAILFVSPMSDEELAAANHAAASARDFFLDHIRHCRAHPGDNFISDLIAANDADEEPLSDEQIAINSFLLYFAGHDTQQSQFSLMVDVLDRHRDARAWLMQDPQRIVACAPELYRFDATGMFMPRTASVDLELGGQTVRAGQSLMCSMTAANRDPEAFAEPDTLNFNRAPVHGTSLRNMTFGTGRHSCLGAYLAQTNLPIMLAGLLSRIGDFEVDRANARRLPTMEVRGFQSLPIVWRHATTSRSSP